MLYQQVWKTEDGPWTGHVASRGLRDCRDDSQGTARYYRHFEILIRDLTGKRSKDYELFYGNVCRGVDTEF